MTITKAPPLAAFFKFAAGLRFKQLFYLIGGLFVLDMMIPDLIPFVDELLLGLLTLLLASWKKNKKTAQEETDMKTIEGRVVEQERCDREAP